MVTTDQILALLSPSAKEFLDRPSQGSFVSQTSPIAFAEPFETGDEIPMPHFLKEEFSLLRGKSVEMLREFVDAQGSHAITPFPGSVERILRYSADAVKTTSSSR
jgi:hypothetical protein